jgi:23S rRNA pseudouridine1911/1915/1917 synthase
MGASRAKIQNAATGGRIKINGKVAKASKKIQPGDKIVCTIIRYPPIELVPEDIPIEVVYEDEHLLVVNKPAGMVTHPGLGNRYGTLVNAVLYHLGQRDSIKIEVNDDDEAEVQYLTDQIRPGIVHRLDKDTSGLLLISKSPELATELQKQFRNRTISREYNTIVWGSFKEKESTIEGNIGRNPRSRKQFAVLKRGGKHAITDYWVLEEYSVASLVKVKLRTGRTHQIRVHFSYKNKPVIGDELYGGAKSPVTNSRIKKDLSKKLLANANRQMLHARVLTFTHPVTGERIETSCELPEDFQNILSILNK